MVQTDKPTGCWRYQSASIHPLAKMKTGSKSLNDRQRMYGASLKVLFNKVVEKFDGINKARTDNRVAANADGC